MSTKHKNYEMLNLIGYGLAKFDNSLIKEFGFSTKNSFYDYCIKQGVADTSGTIKNRMDMFDHFFPENGRKGWWQKGDTYKHRKLYIDSLFGNEDVKGFANTIKLYLQEKFNAKNIDLPANPIIESRFKKMQETGLEAELYFLNNYQSIEIFNGGEIKDARLYGDGYDFQINFNTNFLLVEVKGVRRKSGSLRFTENEFNKARKYKSDYVLSIILNLNEVPIIKTIINPVKELEFKQVKTTSKINIEYQLISPI